uniref:Nucleolar protein 56 n=1 Tax=Favella ehrenbergii TaxID=182087 RepID=A0A7S3HYU7_9SPIT
MAIGAPKVTPTLKNFLATYLPASKSSKKQKFALGISDAKLGPELFSDTGITAVHNDTTMEMIRGIRMHYAKLLQNLTDAEVTKAQLGLGHSFSRTRCATDVNRQDKPITQTIALIEQMDKDINTFAMRLKEWFAWHFPELTKIVNDNTIYARIVDLCDARRDNLTEDLKEEIEQIVLDEEKAAQIIDAVKISMGMDISDQDALQIKKWAERVTELMTFRETLSEFLKQRMSAVAPNLQALIGEIVGSKLIAHAGGLTNLSKYPASTIQILGAEKALFRALKTKGKTPKYGLLFNSTFIGRAGAANKGKISRYLANKCAIASRIDCFSEYPTAKIGESLRDQVEERLKFIASGTKPRKNKEAMEEVLQELKQEGLFYGDNAKKVEATAAGNDANEDETDEERVAKKSKKDKKEKKEKKSKKEDKEEKKSKKRKRSEVEDDSDDEDAQALKEAAKTKKKSKSK